MTLRFSALQSTRKPFLGNAVLVWALLLIGGAVPVPAQAQVLVLSAAAVRPPLEAAVAIVQSRLTQYLHLTFGTAGAISDRVTAGDPVDIVVLPPNRLTELAQKGFVAPDSIVPLGAVRLGAAVPAGTPLPPLATEAEFRATLLAAPSIGLADPASGATSGTYLAGLLNRLGIEQTLRARLHLYSDGTEAMQALSRHEVALAAGQISEIRPVPGIAFAGPLPEALQLRSVYAAAVATHAQAPEAARQVVALLHSPTMAAAFADAGFDPPAE